MFELAERLNRLEQLIDREELRAIDSDQIVIMNGVSWQVYEGLLESLQDSSEFRVMYSEGILKIMSPSRRHESEKKRIALLLESYFLEMGVDFYPLGSTTFREQSVARGIEPDECYCINSEKSVPDIAIEVVVSSGGVSSLEIYQGLSVPEVWFWQKGSFLLYSLQETGYQEIERSQFLPKLDIKLLASYILSSGKPKDIILEFRQRLKNN
ncbi:MAG: Uma2 family endonuclease [Cyanobacteriota bacterium]|nr:Uma2 family endonuclease [Cyanobacteriota bacterium]